ncbi:hypothetical protein [Streptomyces sp. NBC_00388]|uniref:hypothetical protein n=1 Tax=Streptomyces sp. NBC_00388 TaxID=2975735 RepID=UPI002E1B6DAE
MGYTLQESVAGYALVLPWGRLTLGIVLAMAGALLASFRPAHVDVPKATAAH